jgi:hypothetical protein
VVVLDEGKIGGMKELCTMIDDGETWFVNCTECNPPKFDDWSELLELYDVCDGLSNEVKGGVAMGDDGSCEGEG